MIFWRICRPLDAAFRLWRRMSASSGLALSAMTSSSRMEVVIFSSRKRLPRRDRNRLSTAVRSPPSSFQYSFTRRAQRSTPAMSSSSRVFSVPPRSARYRLSPTGLMPEKAGLPRRPIISRAASVSPWSRSTSSTAVRGDVARARSRASALLVWSASMARTAGSSSVRMDLSNNSLIALFSP